MSDDEHRCLDCEGIGRARRSEAFFILRGTSFRAVILQIWRSKSMRCGEDKSGVELHFRVLPASCVCNSDMPN